MEGHAQAAAAGRLTAARAMPEIRVTAHRVVEASPVLVYGIISDYREGHPTILPPRHFPGGLEVLSGGTGAGTRIRFRMTVLGTTREAVADVTEPEPGRVLVETIPGGPVTRFVVEPLEGGDRSRVTFDTTWSTPGLMGYVERLLAPPALRKIYLEELDLLAGQAARRAKVVESTRISE